MVLSWKPSRLAKMEVITHVSAESQTSRDVGILPKPRVRLWSRGVFWIVRPHGVISPRWVAQCFITTQPCLCLSPRTTDQALALRSAVCCRDSSKATSARPSYIWEKACRPILAIYFLGGCYKVLISLGNKTFSWQPKVLPENDHGPGCQCFWCSGPNPNSGLI